MEDTADRQQAITSIKTSADDLISKVKSKEHEGLPEEERIKIDGKHCDGQMLLYLLYQKILPSI